MLDRLDPSLILLSVFIQEFTEPFDSDPYSIVGSDNNVYQVYTIDGITYISEGGRSHIQKHNFDNTVIIEDQSDGTQIGDLTIKLIRQTEKVIDVKIPSFKATWGIKKDSSPFLIDCKADFTPNSQLEQFAGNLPQIILFIAMETATLQEPGICFSNKPSCLGNSQNICRRKIELYNAKRFSDSISSSNVVGYLLRRLTVLCPTIMNESVSVCRHCYNMFSSVRKKSTLSKGISVKEEVTIRYGKPTHVEFVQKQPKTKSRAVTISFQEQTMPTFKPVVPIPPQKVERKSVIRSCSSLGLPQYLSQTDETASARADTLIRTSTSRVAQSQKVSKRGLTTHSDVRLNFYKSISRNHAYYKSSVPNYQVMAQQTYLSKPFPAYIQKSKK